MFGFLKNRRRARIRREPFPPEWLRIIEKNVPMYRRLSEDDRRELPGHVRVFLAEKRFEGCGGLEMTDEVQVTIAAQACILLLRLDEVDYYPRLRSVVVYPRGYVAHQATRDGHVVHEAPSARLGESWGDGAVVLSWSDARAGAADARDGDNVVLHEFAHQLDQEDGAADGTPELPFGSYVPWARVLGRRYLELRKAARTGGKALLDRYGATNEAEFFAVATECFFEKPQAMLRRYPDLYDELKAYYGQDPASASAVEGRAEGAG